MFDGIIFVDEFDRKDGGIRIGRRCLLDTRCPVNTVEISFETVSPTDHA